MSLRLAPLDVAVIAVYFTIVTVIAYRAGRHRRSARDFLIGGREIPWWAAMLSIIGTEVSALTFVGVPAYAFAVTGNFAYLLGAVGMIIARIVVARWFVPVYYRYDVVSVYEFLERRFGPWTRNAAVLVFMCTRVAMSGVRLYAGSIIVGEALGVRWEYAILVTAIVAAVYTIAGGIRSVIWTEVMQVGVMFGGALLAAGLLLMALPYGWDSVLQATAGLHKFSFIDPAGEFTPWSALLGLSVFNLSVFGTDYDMVQRMLTTPDAGRSARAVITSALADVPISALFLTIGVLLFSYYHFFPDSTLPIGPDGAPVAKQVFSHFIVTRLPRGVAGLVVAGLLSVALSSFQSALNALSTSFTADIYARHLVRSAPDAHYVLATRAATCAFAVLLTGVAFLACPAQNLLILGLEIPSYTYCALLGVFLTGIFTRRGSDWSCTAAVAATIPFVFFFCHRYACLPWTWNALAGTIFSLAVALGMGWGRIQEPHAAASAPPAGEGA